MSLKPLLLDYGSYWEAELSWSKPRVVPAGQCPTLLEWIGESYGVYRIERRHHLCNDRFPEVLRVGIAYDQTLSERLKQYPAGLLDRWRAKGTVSVSAAKIVMEHQHRRVRYEEIEHMLVHFLGPAQNEKKKYSPPAGPFQVTNTGFKGRLPRLIVFPAYAFE